MSLEKVTVEYTSKVDDLEAGLNKVKRANEGVSESAKKTGKDIEDGFVKGSNGAKRFEAELKRTTRTQAEMELKLQRLKELLRDDTTLGSSAFKKVQAEVKKTEAEIDKLNRKSDNYGSTLKRIGALAAGAFALSRIKAFGAELIKTQREAEILANQFAFVAGSVEAGQASFERLRRVSQKLGLDFDSLSQEYTKFATASKTIGISNEQSLKTFEDMSLGLRGAGSGVQQQQRAFLALTQIMSKGRVQGEELTQQLGEALPGAVGIAAKAMGVTTAELMKMMQAGQIMASDFIPKFAAAVRDEFAGAMSGKKDSLDSSINRANNELDEFKRNLSDTGVFASFYDLLAKITNRQNALYDANINGFERLSRRMLELMGLGSLNNDLINRTRASEQMKALAGQRAHEQAMSNAKAIMDMNADARRDALQDMNMQEALLLAQKDAGTITALQEQGLKRISATREALKELESNAAAAKVQSDKLEQENAEKAIKLQKKKEQALKDYIKAMNEQFNLLQEMDAQEEANLADSINIINERSQKEIEAKNKTADEIEATIINFDDWQKQKMDEMLAESDKAYQTDAENFKKAQSQKERAIQAFIQAATGLANNFFALQFSLARQDAQLQIDNNRNLLDTKRISEEEYNARIIQIKRDQFRKEQNLQRAQAVMNGALAVTEILSKWAAVPPVAAGLIALTAASVGAQIAAIDAQTPGFKDGVIDLQGEGTTTSDSITARLSRGESVMTAEETRQHKADLMAIRDGNWNDHVKKTYIMPELNKIAQKESKSLAQNMAASMGMNGLDDTNIVHAIRKNRTVKLHPDTVRELSAANALGANKVIGRRKW